MARKSPKTPRKKSVFHVLPPSREMNIASLVTMTVRSSWGLTRTWLNEYGAFPPATFTSVTFRQFRPPSSVRYSSLPMIPEGVLNL